MDIDRDDHSPTNNFRKAIERTVWAHSNLDSDTRADVLEEFEEALRADESVFDDTETHIQHVLERYGYEPPAERREE